MYGGPSRYRSLVAVDRRKPRNVSPASTAASTAAVTSTATVFRPTGSVAKLVNKVPALNRSGVTVPVPANVNMI